MIKVVAIDQLNQNRKLFHPDIGKVVEIELTKEEKTSFTSSVNAVKELIKNIK